ncbi:hypothetical protein KUV59_05670 [Marinobacter daepoensis]|uniref:type I restriction-modification enzyme R subunit C-terminal domain-containing protein n=1 Tax=Marinobacter daepoensis TaxID=262077 RepID=UPI001C961594|nr:hypothetical protein [Marinobacter daepoensis]
MHSAGEGNQNLQHHWTANQRKWLEPLAKQLVHKMIIDREFVKHRFADNGGAKQMNKVLGQPLERTRAERAAMKPAKKTRSKQATV